MAACAPLSGDLAEALDSRAGKPTPQTATGHAASHEIRAVDDETFQLAWRRPDHCSHAMTTRKSDRIVLGWHFLEQPPPTGCTYFNTGA